MFGISGFEFLVILIVAIAVVPAERWPAVAGFIGKVIRSVRRMFDKVQDGVNNLENEISKDLPIDNLSQKTMDDMIATFAAPIKPKGKKKSKK
jgi:Sec-independent protein translocase protein TatA